jgi:hypothetical protein
MARWHCPVCGLDFAFHSELDWHVREAHSLKRTAGLAGQLERKAVLSWGLLRQLHSAHEGLSASLFLWTTPAAVMTRSDAANLRQLATRAGERLCRDLRGEALARIESRLGEAVRAAESGPTDHGLAVFVSETGAAVVPLPYAPRERVVVNPTFAVRELLDALERCPMYRVLVLRGPGFRLLEGRGERLSEVRDWQVPNPSLWRAARAETTLTCGACWTPRQRRRAAFASADRAIGERVALGGRLPLILIGRKRLLAKYRRCSPHAPSIVGEVPAWGSMLSREDIAQRAAPVVAKWREKHATEYLDALAAAESQGQVVWGLQPVWEAVLAGKAERLWVQRDYWLPARLADNGKRLVPVDEGEAPGAAQDAIDLVVERAVLAGAHVEMVERLPDGPGRERIAAQLGQPPGAAAYIDLDERGLSWSAA